MRIPDPDELSDDEWYERGREVVLTKLDSRAHTRGELGVAMSRNGVPEQVQHQVLDRFEELGLVDDGNFAMQWVESRHGARGLSRRAVAMELSRKGVDPDVIDEAVNHISDDDEARAAVDLARKKFRTGASVPEPRLTRRVAAALARKGYGPDITWQAVRQVKEELGNDEW